MLWALLNASSIVVVFFIYVLICNTDHWLLKLFGWNSYVVFYKAYICLASSEVHLFFWGDLKFFTNPHCLVNIPNVSRNLENWSYLLSFFVWNCHSMEEFDPSPWNFLLDCIYQYYSSHLMSESHSWQCSINFGLDASVISVLLNFSRDQLIVSLFFNLSMT